MIDPALSEAMAEAYASAPTLTAWDTLELNHSTLDTPARVILDHGVLLSENPIAWGRMLKLEDDAPFNPGETVAFYAAGMDIKLPDYQEGQLPTLTISIDNVSGRLRPVLKRAIAVAEPIKLTVRQYLAHDPDTVHWRLRGLHIRRASASTMRVEADAAFSNLREQNFGLTYTRERFPSLANR